MDVNALVDYGRFGLYQLAVVALCTMCVVMDRFDVRSMSTSQPAVIRECAIAKESLAPVFGAGW